MDLQQEQNTLIYQMTELFTDFTKLNKFVIEMFNDERLSDELKNEYATKYNELNIHKMK